MKLKISILAILTLLLLCGQSLALDFGSNITRYDRESTSETGWYGKQEDQEIEGLDITLHEERDYLLSE